MSRRRARIAMVGVPIVSHVLPSLALIRELVARGRRVTYANAPSRITPPTSTSTASWRRAPPC